MLDTTYLWVYPNKTERYLPIGTYCLSQGVLHRDLKLENVLLSADKLQVAITDFGLSNTWSEGKILNTHCGTPEYAAPELFAKKNYGPKVKYRA